MKSERRSQCAETRDSSPSPPSVAIEKQKPRDNRWVSVCAECERLLASDEFRMHCDGCEHWFHGSCVDVEEYETFDIDKFYCSRCERVFGFRSSAKKSTNIHRRDRTELGAEQKGTESGSPRFILEMLELFDKQMYYAEETIDKLKAQQLIMPHFLRHGFRKPILVEHKDGLDMVVPCEASFNETTVMSKLGADFELKAIHSRRQTCVKMKMLNFVRLMNQEGRERDNNAYSCSFEISKTSLDAEIKVPSIVNRLCWVTNGWPHCDFKPSLSKHCIMSMEGSYTDFHIDCGGTSIWYHVFKGSKLIYLIEPTVVNLERYEQWMLEPNRSEVFFALKVEKCYSLLLNEGQTLFIPSGWIHAVYSPCNSIVFAGNFLHSFNISLQLQIQELENRIHTLDEYKFPYFELTHWYAAATIIRFMQDHLKKITSEFFLKEIDALINALKHWWSKSKKEDECHLLVPSGINCHRLIYDLSLMCKRVRRAMNGEQVTLKRKNCRELDFQETALKEFAKLTKRPRIYHTNGQSNDQFLYDAVEQTLTENCETESSEQPNQLSLDRFNESEHSERENDSMCIENGQIEMNVNGHD